MIVQAARVSPSNAHPPVRSDHSFQTGVASFSAPVDTVTISDAARSRQLADADTRGQWESALAMQRSGVPQLIDAESAIVGGTNDMQSRIQQWLTGQRFDTDTRFSLSYDAASKSFNVDGSPEVKVALEAALNSATPSPSAAAMRNSYALLEDMSSGLDAVRKQYALDQAAGGHDVASRREGFAYRFSMEWFAGHLSHELKVGNASA